MEGTVNTGLDEISTGQARYANTDIPFFSPLNPYVHLFQDKSLYSHWVPVVFGTDWRSAVEGQLC